MQDDLIRADFALYRKEECTPALLRALAHLATLCLILLAGWLMLATPQ